MSASTWEAIAARKQAQLHSRIPKAWLLPSHLLPSPNSSESLLSIPSKAVPSILSWKEFSITDNYDATSLAQAIRDKKFTAEEVAVAYCKRAAIAQQVCSCLTEIFFENGIERGRWLDREFERRGAVVGPLHGVPISVKDTFKVKGYDCAGALVSLAENPANENATLVDILLEAGAVFYCKTRPLSSLMQSATFPFTYLMTTEDICQTVMTFDSHNNIFGRVINPINPLLSAGGSSGGEGALVAMHGSALGIGTDIGGSIRVPAMCNGIYGLKPSAGRIPMAGSRSGAVPSSEKISLVASAGPLARSIRDCGLLLKAVSEARPWEKDPAIHYGRWLQQGEVSFSKNENGKEVLVIGVLRTDGVANPLPPINSLISETVQKLQQAGHTVVEVSNVTNFGKCPPLASKFFGMDGSNNLLDQIESTGEPLSPWLSTRLPRRTAKNVSEIVKLHAARVELQTELLAMWKTRNRDGMHVDVDVIICPVAPHPVPKIDGWNVDGYASGWVLLDYPAGTIPVREFVEEDLGGEIEGEALGKWDRVNRDLWDNSKIDRKIYLGSPLSIQVVAPRLQEYRLFRAMEIIDQVLHPETATSSTKAKL